MRRLLSLHIARTKAGDAPELDTAEFNDVAVIWDEAFRDAKAIDADVDRASRYVCRMPLTYWRDQLPAILAEIERERTTNIAQTPLGNGDVPNDRLVAERASENCRLCSGCGWCEVFHRDLAPGGDGRVAITNSDGSTSLVGGRFRLTCTCVLGRWFLGALYRSASNCRDVHEADRQRRDADRVAWLPKVIAGQSPYQLDDPREGAAVRAALGRAG